ncbi:hypothetical protein HanXRQr2_Chr14g0639631 [Helianthus annuus]|uniref:DUF4283 domain-containing protein n=1 Tax=Helianthus annuus TaxID=4232 RepID=A0A9K3E7X1_HELAN|nr:hypothetical protein HanXRQr2_Chr14g0639631 [Helianthus annuus]KAJ0659621.1 hypothetical protein HanOQP8_Chr14g0528251 [Helianthus annuus]
MNYASFVSKGTRLYSEVLVHKEPSVKYGGSDRKTEEVHEEISAFFDLHGRAVIGRMHDVKTLNNLNVTLKEAGISFNQLHYMGGLTVMITFDYDVEAHDFITSKKTWVHWFDSLDIWAGQTFPFERIAWLKFLGVPLHLAENKVFNDMVELFGKVIHKSQLSYPDSDFSVNHIGVLVGEGDRVSDTVALKWKGRTFMVRVSVEMDDWIPDCLMEDDWSERKVGEGKEDEEAFELNKERKSQVGGSVETEACGDGEGKPLEVSGGSYEGDSRKDGGCRSFGFKAVDSDVAIRKNHFNLVSSKHKAKPISLSPISDNRPKKHSRSDREDQDCFNFNIFSSSGPHTNNYLDKNVASGNIINNLSGEERAKNIDTVGMEGFDLNKRVDYEGTSETNSRADQNNIEEEMDEVPDSIV